MTDQPDYAAAAARHHEAAGNIPSAGPYQPPDDREPLTVQAEKVRTEAERLYVHDPAAVRHPTWAEFNRFLHEVLGLCRLAAPDGQGNPYLISGTAMEAHGSVPLPTPGETVLVADPSWNYQEVPVTADVTGPFHFDAHTGQWLVFTRYPIPAAHGQPYKSKATAYPVPQEDQ